MDAPPLKIGPFPGGDGFSGPRNLVPELCESDQYQPCGEWDTIRHLWHFADGNAGKRQWRHADNGGEHVGSTLIQRRRSLAHVAPR